jgi:hypothetical protein
MSSKASGPNQPKIWNILIPTNNNFADHLDKLEALLARLPTPVMRVYSSKSNYSAQ